MEDGDISKSFDRNVPIQDLDLEYFDFDAFLDWEPFQVTGTFVGMQQNQVLALPVGKKRRSNGATQPRMKRPRIQPSHICDVHQPSSSKSGVRCFGKRLTMRRHKGTRCERTVATFVDGQLPVCAQHKAQVIKLARCEALLECGFPCNEILPWKPHEYLLCEAHWSKGKCKFMELPAEIRVMIFRYLTPDQPVQARQSGMQRLRQDGAPVSTAILRVNQKIHEEVAGIFYGQTTFDIDVTNACVTPSISMCYAKDERNPLQDYQMQLMLLEQSRVRRNAPSRPIRPNSFDTVIKIVLTPWQPSLSLRCFQRIRCFRINIILDIAKKFPSAGISLQNAETTVAEAERNLLCDYLHQLVERLIMTNQASLQNLDISIRIHGIPDGENARANSEALAHCQALMKPIRRLRSRTASLVSLIRIGNGDRKISLVPIYPKKEDLVIRFIQTCCAKLTTSLAPPPRSPVLVRFDQLAEVVSQMGQHSFWREADIEEMEIVLSHARSARETDDMKAMTSVFRNISDKLKKYNSDHVDFMKQMRQTYETMRGQLVHRSGEEIV